MRDEDFETVRQQMIERQLRCRGIRNPGVLAAMANVPRQRFIDPALADEAYADRALAIACGQTISQPYMVALMTEALQLTGAQRVLEVGTGSGYQTAVLAELAAEVFSVERHAMLSVRAGGILAELGFRNVRLKVGDGTLGWAEHAPFDRILVTAGAAQVPDALWAQLAEGGILVLPIGGRDSQILQAVTKHAGCQEIVSLGGCRFVPLFGQGGWAGND